MVRLNIGGYLEQQNITAYRLVKESGLAPNTVYTLARNPAKRIDLDTLGAVMQALTRLTGQPVTPNDLLEVIEEPEHIFEEMDAEAKAWHDADLSSLGSYEPYDWGDIDPMTLGKPVVNGVVQE